MAHKRMMKKVTTIVVSGLLAVGTLVGCGKGTASTQKDETVTITLMNQETKLGTIEAKAGATLDKEAYEKYEKLDGSTFEGWYETPTLLDSSKKDLAKDTFTESTTLYGNFKAAEVKEDTRLWYIAGTSEKGLLKLNNWAAALSDDDKAKFQLKSTGNKNEFALTIDLYKGDMFQVIHDWSWDGQKGYGKFTSVDDTQMKNAGGLGGTADTSNLEVLVDGNYTITLTTNPDNEAQDTLTIKRNSDPVAAE